MEKKLEDMMEEELKRGFESVKTLDVDSKEYGSAIESISKLYKVKIEDDEKERTFIKECNKADIDQFDCELRAEQSKTQKIGQYIKLAVEAAGIVIPICFYGVWMKKGFEFESKGEIVSSNTFRGLINKFKPTK